MTENDRGSEDAGHPPKTDAHAGNNAGTKRGRDDATSPKRPAKRTKVQRGHDHHPPPFQAGPFKSTSVTDERDIQEGNGTLVMLPVESLDIQSHETAHGVVQTFRPKDQPTGVNWATRGSDGVSVIIKTGDTAAEVANAARFTEKLLSSSGKTWHMELRPEDPVHAAKDLARYRKICANCGREGHTLADCWVPSSVKRGDLYGCPLCNEKHSFDNCNKITKLGNEEAFKILVLNRAGKCRIRTVYPWIWFLEGHPERWPQIKGLPLSTAFIRGLAEQDPQAAHECKYFWDQFRDGQVDPATKDVQTAIENLKNGTLGKEAFVPYKSKAARRKA